MELLSSIADAPAVAADRSTTVVAAINLAEHENYDESCELIDAADQRC